MFARWLDLIEPAVIKNDAALARAVGVPRSTVTRWRRGTLPSAAHLLKLAEATGTSVDTITRIITSSDEEESR